MEFDQHNPDESPPVADESRVARQRAVGFTIFRRNVRIVVDAPLPVEPETRMDTSAKAGTDKIIRPVGVKKTVSLARKAVSGEEVVVAVTPTSARTTRHLKQHDAQVSRHRSRDKMINWLKRRIIGMDSAEAGCITPTTDIGDIKVSHDRVDQRKLYQIIEGIKEADRFYESQRRERRDAFAVRRHPDATAVRAFYGASTAADAFARDKEKAERRTARRR